MITYEDEVDMEIDRWVEAQLEQSPELRGGAVAALWAILSESARAE